MKPFGDKDRDGKLNMFDCKPFDKKRHGKMFRKEIMKEITPTDLCEENYPVYNKGCYKPIVRILEKNPDLYKKIKGVKILIDEIDPFISGKASYDRKENVITISPTFVMPKLANEEGKPIKKDLRLLKKILKHETRHYEVEHLPNKKELYKKWVKELPIKDKIDSEGNIIRSSESIRAALKSIDPSEYPEDDNDAIDALNETSWEERGWEQDAEAFARKKLGRDMGKRTKEKPETLQSLQDELKEDL